MSLDEDTLRIYEEMKAAVNEGDLLSYANKLARKFATPRIMEQQVDRLNNSSVGRSIPAPVREQITREVMDNVRIAQL